MCFYIFKQEYKNRMGLKEIKDALHYLGAKMSLRLILAPK